MSTNQENILHLNRPAAIIFRKPLATNEEMTRELEKLLDSVVPITSNTITSLSGRGIYKAAFISPATNQSHILGYEDNLVFKNYACSAGATQTDNIYKDYLNYDIINKPRIESSSSEQVRRAWRKFLNWSLFDEYGNSVFSRSKITALFNGQESISDINIYSFIPFAGTIGKTLSNAIVSYFSKIEQTKDVEAGTSTDLVIKAVEGDTTEAEMWKRTWFVLSFDSEYYVPDYKYSYTPFASTVTETANYSTLSAAANPLGEGTYTFNKKSVLKGLRVPALDYKVIYSAETLTREQFEDYVDLNYFPKVVEKLKENPIVGYYKIILQGVCDYEHPQVITKKKALENLNSFNNVYKGKENLSILSNLDDFYQVCTAKFNSMGDSATKTPLRLLDAYKDLVEVTDGNQYRIKLSDLITSKNSIDFIQKIKKGTSELSITGVPYASILSSNSSSVKYFFSDVAYLYFSQDTTLKELITSYYLLCRDFNDNVNNTFTDVDINRLAGYEEEFPLRYRGQTTQTGYVDTYTSDVDSSTIANQRTSQLNTYNTSEELDSQHITFNSALHLKSLYDSYGRARVGSKRAASQTFLSRFINSNNTTLLDFKLMYYMLIKYNVVIPKYNKLQPDFIMGDSKYSPVRMFPSDFFTVTAMESTETLETITINDIPGNPFGQKEATTTVEDYSVPFQTQLQRYLDKSDEDKKKLIDIYERVYFGDWAGFYYTNATPKNETKSVYTNTNLNKDLYTNVVSKIGTDLKTIGGNDIETIQSVGLSDLVNTDVVSVNISRQTMGKSQATINLKNVDEKYTYKNGVFFGETLFEPMDEVLIYLPTYDESLELSFKGYVSDVENINQRGYHSLSIVCDCPLKLIDIVRTNLKPAYSFDESEYKPIHPFTVPPDLMKSVDQWVPFMFAQGLSYFTSMLGNSDDKRLVYTISRIDSKKLPREYIQGPNFNDPLLAYMWYRRSKHALDQKQAQEAFRRLIGLYVKTIKYTNLAPLETYTTEDGITPLQSLLTKNSSLNKSKVVKTDYQIYAQRLDNTSVPNKRVVGNLTGTLQPAFALGVSEVPLVFSEYKTNLSVLLETAEKFNFFLYSDRKGVVNFVPPNISLAHLSERNGEFSVFDMLTRSNLNYEYKSPDIINKQTAIMFQESTDDSRIVNWMQLSGGFIQSNSMSAINAGVATTVANYPSIVKYGVHSQKQQAILGVKSKAALEAYGYALMDRSNKNFRTATYDCSGTGDMDINKTVYSAISNTIYLRTGLNLTYIAGQNFTASSTLNWGRRPLCTVRSVYLHSKLMDTLDVPALMEQIELLKNNNCITYSYYSQIMAILRFVSTNNSTEQFNRLFASFVFNGYFWDGIPSISFEDLAASYYTQNISSGFQTPVFTLATFGSNNATLSKIESVATSIIGKLTSRGLKNTSNVSIGLFTESSAESIARTYLRPNEFVLRGKGGK